MVYNVVGQGIRTLINNGLVEILIFTLLFAIIFGILMNVHLFGEENDNGKKYNAVIALAMSALSILPHYVMRGSRYDLVTIVSNAIPQTMLVLVVILCVLILLGMFGWNMDAFNPKDGESSWLKPVVFMILIGIVGWIFFSASGHRRLPYWLSYDVMAIVVAVAVFGGIMYFIMGGKDD